jgi:hypothetical protein
MSYLKMRVQCDDGYVAWLNGTEISSQSKPATLSWNSAATSGANDDAAVTWREISLRPRLGLLREGANLLAVQAMNSGNSSSDLLFNCELEGGIDGINSPRLLLTGLQPADAGDYTLTITNPVGTVTSDAAAVILPPGVDVQPAAVSVEAGETATISLTASGAALAYQWFRGTSGDRSNPIAGANAAAFTTPALFESTSYWVLVSNAAGTADSETAVVSVSAIPPWVQWQRSEFPAALANDPAVSSPPADPDGDGITNEQEYILGSSPLRAAPAPALAITLTANRPTVSFTARRATGPGYGGRHRFYSLQTAIDPSQSWTPAPGLASIHGDDQRVEFTPPAGVQRQFYRLLVRLDP